MIFDEEYAKARILLASKPKSIVISTGYDRQWNEKIHSLRAEFPETMISVIYSKGKSEVK